MAATASRLARAPAFAIALHASCSRSPSAKERGHHFATASMARPQGGEVEQLVDGGEPRRTDSYEDHYKARGHQVARRGPLSSIIVARQEEAVDR